VLKRAPIIALPPKKGPSGLRFTRFDWNWYTLYANAAARGKPWSVLNSTLQVAPCDTMRHDESGGEYSVTIGTYKGLNPRLPSVVLWVFKRQGWSQAVRILCLVQLSVPKSKRLRT
jgi:hypothetical protein